MIRFVPTTDYALVKRVLTHPKIWPTLADDFSGHPEEFEPLDSLATIGYVAVWDDAELCGLATFAYQNRICWEIHVALLPRAWGRKSRRIARALAEWLWSKTDCQRIVATINQSNLPALCFAEGAGFVLFGVNQSSVQRNGRLEDRMMFGISRP